MRQTKAPAGPADGNAHLVVAAKAVELVELVGGVAGPGPHLAGAARQLTVTSCRKNTHYVRGLI